MARYFYNQKELAHFHSDDVGEFRAVTELGRLFSESWNHQKDFVEGTWAVVDTFCRHNYWLDESFMVQRQGECGGGQPGDWGQCVCVCVCVCVCERERERERERDKETERD